MDARSERPICNQLIDATETRTTIASATHDESLRANAIVPCRADTTLSRCEIPALRSTRASKATTCQTLRLQTNDDKRCACPASQTRQAHQKAATTARTILDAQCGVEKPVHMRMPRLLPNAAPAIRMMTNAAPAQATNQGQAP